MKDSIRIGYNCYCLTHEMHSTITTIKLQIYSLFLENNLIEPEARPIARCLTVICIFGMHFIHIFYDYRFTHCLLRPLSRSADMLEQKNKNPKAKNSLNFIGSQPTKLWFIDFFFIIRLSYSFL